MAVIRTLRNEPPDADTLGGRLSRTRDGLGLSLSSLARRIGVKPRTIEEWESDRSEPSVEHLTLIAGAMKVNIVWLLHGVGEAPSDEIGPDPLAAIAAQLEKLQRLHEDTGRIIARLTRELRRIEDERL